jgi:hypothetical protein
MRVCQVEWVDHIHPDKWVVLLLPLQFLSLIPALAGVHSSRNEQASTMLKKRIGKGPYATEVASADPLEN